LFFGLIFFCFKFISSLEMQL